MILEIAAGIILAYFIIGLLEDYPLLMKLFWVIFGLFVIWLILPADIDTRLSLSSISAFIIFIIFMCGLVRFCNYMQPKIENWWNKRKGK